jgi:hypothetical protein
MIDSWMKDTQRNDLYFYDLFKGITSKIRDVLISIHADKIDVLKTLILKAFLIIDKISYPYYETFNIIESVQYIVLINNDLKLKDDTFYNEKFLKEILYKEFDRIYCNLESTINQVGLILNYEKTSENYEGLKNSDHCLKLKPKLNDQNLSYTINFFELSDKMIEDILPVDNNTNSYVEAHSGGLKKSRRCAGSDIQLFIREKYKLVCPENMRQCLKICYSFLYDLIEIDLKIFFGKTFVCNKTTTKVLAMLFHFYSEIKKRNTKYEIIMKENNEYQIKWSLSKKASNEAIEDFLMKQEIQDLSNFKIIHILFGFGECFSTLKSDYLDNKQRVVNRHLRRIEEEINYAETKLKDWLDTKKQALADKIKLLNENEIRPIKYKLNSGHHLKHLERIEEKITYAEKQIKFYRDMKEKALADKRKLLNENEIEPIKDKLFLFSCGHQLRSKRLAKLLKKRYTKCPKSLKCPYSNECGAVYIVGCYEADLYEIW